MAVGEAHIDYLIALIDIDCVDTFRPGIRVSPQTCLLDEAHLRCKDDEMSVEEFVGDIGTQPQTSVYGVARLESEEVLDGTSLRVLVAFRNLVALHPVATALACEEEHRLMHCCRVDKLGEILLAGTCSLGPYSTAGLLTEVGQRCALDVAEMANSDDNRIVGIEVLSIELMLVGDNLRTTLITILFLDFIQVILHHLLAAFRVVENLLELIDSLHQVVILSMELVDLQTCQ